MKRLAMVVLFVSGCASTLPEVDEGRAVQHEAHARILLADSIAIQALSQGYRESNRRIGAKNYAADLRDPENQELEEIPVLPEPDEEGRILLSEVRFRELRYLTPEMAELLGRDYLGYLARSEEELEELLSMWRAARDGNEENYERLRAHISREWSQRPVFGPDEIEGIGRGIEEGLD